MNFVLGKSDSTIGPRSIRHHMFMKMWRRPKCKNMAVTNRHHSWLRPRYPTPTLAPRLRTTLGLISAMPAPPPATASALTCERYQVMPNIAMLTAMSSAVAVPGIGITPRMRLLPAPLDPRARAGRTADPQRGHTLALRSMRPRQEGHILKAEA